MKSSGPTTNWLLFHLIVVFNTDEVIIVSSLPSAHRHCSPWMSYFRRDDNFNNIVG